MLMPFRVASIAARWFGVVTLSLLFMAAGSPAVVSFASPLGATAPGLGTSASFAVLGGSAVTNTGPTVVTRDLGVSPGTAITGFPPGNVSGGVIHNADAVALQAKSDLTSAYNNLAGQACNTTLTGQDLGGKTLTPGVYCFSSSAQLTGKLTLDAQGNPNAIFVFQIGSTLTTASAASVSVINTANACNVYWQIGSSATLGTGTAFAGNILALASISLTTGANVSGRALARVGAVTMDTNNVSAANCVAAATATPTATATATARATNTATASATNAATAIASATALGTSTSVPTLVPTVPGFVNTPVPTASNTPGPTATPQPPERDATNTPVPAPSNTPMPAQPFGPQSAFTPSGPTTLAILHVPDTGGAPLSGGDSLSVALTGGLIAAAIMLSVLGIWYRARHV